MPLPTHPYQGQAILLASQHRKEQAIAPPFQHHLACTLHVPPFDTDVYGTFTGEIARVGSQYDTLLRKAREAASHFNRSLVIASEGSFGPHPDYPWVAGSVEMMAFIDITQGLVITEQQITTTTNYAYLDLRPGEDYKDFLMQVGFPAHGLVLRSVPSLTVLAKGVVELQALLAHLDAGFASHAQLRLETDMRAHLNPTRMQVLSHLAEQLAARVAQCCDQCGCPGFGERKVQGHLPCQACAAPTRLYAQQVLRCLRCSHTQLLARPDGRAHADPQYCDFCNP